MNEINRRFKQYRLHLNMSQKDLSLKSGVSLRTIINFENGEDIKLSSLNKLLKALGMKNAIDELIMDVTDRPSYRAKLEKNQIRERASKEKPKSTWTWGI